jgi:hypothetical protein
MSKSSQKLAQIPRAQFVLLRPESEAIAAIAKMIGAAAAKRVQARKVAR